MPQVIERRRITESQAAQLTSQNELEKQELATRQQAMEEAEEDKRADISRQEQVTRRRLEVDLLTEQTKERESLRMQEEMFRRQEELR